MSEQTTVTINGVLYDIETGQPVDAPRSQAKNAHALHAHTAKATTLNRKYVTQPSRTGGSAHGIQKFASHPVMDTTVVRDIAPVPHPAVAKAHAAHLKAKQSRAVKPSHVIKKQAIAEAMEKSKQHSRKQVKSPRVTTGPRRVARLAAAAAAVVVLGGYLTYLNMPALSTRVAAAQAGINATYPGYSPSGYRLSGPVAYNSGMVTIKFTANAGPQSYTITQERSSWDSTAVRENYVVAKVGEQYTTTQANGLTIYTYGQNAAWVNGGILYTISGDAPLSSDQVQRIAVSM